MAVEFKDYYKLLGVKRDAGDEEIRKAFRNLARQYHPDVAKDKATAETKFKEINEAYEVLGDPAKRKKYDALGSQWRQGADFQPPPGFQRQSRAGGSPGEAFEFRFGGTGFSDFFEQLFGAAAAQGGRGVRSPGFSPFENGAGRGDDLESDIMVSLHEALSGSVRSITVQRQGACDQCFGMGSVNGALCPKCQGRREQVLSDTYKVRIPAGVQENQRLRIAGRGGKGAGSGIAGDLYLRVRFEKHPDLQPDGADLQTEIELAPWEAVLGANLPVPTLEGPLQVKVPAGSQNGQRLRIRNKGLPQKDKSRGDLYVTLRVELPKELTPSERDLWEKLATASSFNPRH